jgi:hypothetical protein
MDTTSEAPSKPPEVAQEAEQSSSKAPQAAEKPPTAPKKRVGRPRKAAVAKKKAGNRGAVGRPKGDAAIINEYKARMLNSPKSRKVLDKIFEAALDDEHKHQAAAWKLVMDRIVPVSGFDRDAVKGAGSGGINITINGAVPSNEKDISPSGTVEGEWTKVGGDDA